ncbi:MAG: dockerin type I repeat-containing protein [Clostridia bacterium]|nr:dockerin type I repeat-containing protein [Clostridia bacterium]
MKKYIALLISVIMILGIMPVNAFAADVIATVKIGDISAPVAGEKPDYVATYGTGYNFTKKFDGVNTKFGIAWVDVTNGQKTMTPDDVFVTGHIYRVAVVVVAGNGYSFSKSDNYTSTVSGYINNNKGKVYAVSGFNAGEYAGITYTFEACPYNVVSSVAVTDLDVPASGEKFDFTASTADKGYFVNSIYWKDVTANKNMNENDVAIAGHKYEVEIWLRVNDGYKLKVDRDGCPDVTAKIGAYNATVITSVSDIVVGITDSYIVPDDITSVTVSGIDAPVTGATPDTTATCGSGYTISEIVWVDTTGEYKDWVYNVTEFEAEREYTVQITLNTIGNYRFVMDGPYNDVSGKINNNSATVYGSNSATEVAIGYEFPATEKPAPTIIPSVYVNGIDAPVVGATPDTEGTCGEGYEITEIIWVDTTGEYKDHIVGITEFEAEREYTVQITLAVKDGYEFSSDGYYNDVTGEINMEPAIEYGTDSVTEMTIGYEFPVVEAVHTHSYNPVVTPPTCTEKGFTTYGCACGDSYIDDYIDATGHTPGEWEVVKNAEIGVEGKEQKKCTGCGEVLEERAIPALTEPSDDILLGDVNKDTRITAADARLALRISAKLQTATDYQNKAADMNMDGKITAADARKILRKSAKLE